MNTEFTFGGVTNEQFEEACKTCISYFDGLAAAPFTEENETASLLCGMHGMMLNMAHERFIARLRKLRDNLERKLASESAELPDCSCAQKPEALS